MELLSVVEHESLPIVQSRLPGQYAVTDRHARALVDLEGKVPSKAWSWGHQHVRFGHFCGVISLGDLSIEILPKVFGSEVDPGSSRQALIRMLVVSRLLKLRRAGVAGIALQKHGLLDVFLLNFCEQLRAELTQGVIRTYVKRNENLNVVRGKLRIEQQLKYNLTHRERLFCRYDELSDDNLHNQVLKRVLSILLTLASSNRARVRIAELLMRLDAISDVEITPSMLDSLVFDRSTNRYKQIFAQCRWFLEGYHPDVLAGQAHCIALMFDMNQLFESYVGAVFRKVAAGSGYRVREQGPQQYFARRDDSDLEVFRMKPDISFIDENKRIVAIADAKWKMLDDGDRKLSISQADLYQMQSYATRYSVGEVMLVYPMQVKMTEIVRLRLNGSGTMVTILPFDVTSVGGRDQMREGLSMLGI